MDVIKVLVVEYNKAFPILGEQLAAYGFQADRSNAWDPAASNWSVPPSADRMNRYLFDRRIEDVAKSANVFTQGNVEITVIGNFDEARRLVSSGSYNKLYIEYFIDKMQRHSPNEPVGNGGLLVATEALINNPGLRVYCIDEHEGMLERLLANKEHDFSGRVAFVPKGNFIAHIFESADKRPDVVPPRPQPTARVASSPSVFAK